jgi:hypothetical protein
VRQKWAEKEKTTGRQMKGKGDVKKERKDMYRGEFFE